MPGLNNRAFFMRAILSNLAVFTLLFTLHANAGEPMIVDVRSASEYQAQHVEGATNIEFQSIVDGLQQRNVDTSTEIFLYCGSGKRAGMALDSLNAAGYNNVTNLGGLEQALVFSAQHD
jgi:phage shock protein E